MSVQTLPVLPNSISLVVNSTVNTLIILYALRYRPADVISEEDTLRWLEEDGWNLRLVEWTLRETLSAAILARISTDPNYLLPDIFSLVLSNKQDELNMVMDAFWLKAGIFFESTPDRDYDLLAETICAILLNHQSN